MKASALDVRARQAIQELRKIRCADPAADDALDAVRLAIHTLEHWWLPELARNLSETRSAPR
jgi:hypothetical protein